MKEITYREEPALDPEEFRELLIDSTLGERRPVHDHARISQMVKNSNLIITAREGSLLVGVSRSVSDLSFCTYLSDLAVRKAYQRKGIGKRLIAETKRVTPDAKLILLSAPAAIHYYPHIGMRQHQYCYYIDSLDDLKMSF